jgi:hypothetical protein
MCGPASYVNHQNGSQGYETVVGRCWGRNHRSRVRTTPHRQRTEAGGACRAILRREVLQKTRVQGGRSGALSVARMAESRSRSRLTSASRAGAWPTGTSTPPETSSGPGCGLRNETWEVAPSVFREAACSSGRSHHPPYSKGVSRSVRISAGRPRFAAATSPR